MRSFKIVGTKADYVDSNTRYSIYENNKEVARAIMSNYEKENVNDTMSKRKDYDTIMREITNMLIGLYNTDFIFSLEFEKED